MPKPLAVKSLLQMCLHHVSLRLKACPDDGNELVESSMDSVKEENKSAPKCVTNPFADLRRLRFACFV